MFVVDLEAKLKGREDPLKSHSENNYCRNLNKSHLRNKSELSVKAKKKSKHSSFPDAIKSCNLRTVQ